MYSVLSGDIIASTSLSKADKVLVEQNLVRLIDDLTRHFKLYGRVVKGDYLECATPIPEHGLAVAIATKAFVKTIQINDKAYTENKSRVRLFQSYGIRVALAYGELSRFSAEDGVMDGEAIYLSGRAISGLSTHDKERVVIKNTLFFDSNDEKLATHMAPIMSLLDVLLYKATARQCEVVYHKLLGKSEDEIAQLLGINQSVVNQHSTSVGWNAIEQAVAYYHKTISDL